MLFQTNHQNGWIRKQDAHLLLWCPAVVMTAAALWLPLMIGVAGAYVTHRNGWFKAGETQ